MEWKFIFEQAFENSQFLDLVQQLDSNSVIQKPTEINQEKWEKLTGQSETVLQLSEEERKKLISLKNQIRQQWHHETHQKALNILKECIQKQEIGRFDLEDWKQMLSCIQISNMPFFLGLLKFIEQLEETEKIKMKIKQSWNLDREYLLQSFPSTSNSFSLKRLLIILNQMGFFIEEDERTEEKLKIDYRKVIDTQFMKQRRVELKKHIRTIPGKFRPAGYITPSLPPKKFFCCFLL